MSEIISFEEVEKRILTIKGKQVILDKDVAELYGVETREVNQAVKNNPEKFPEGYILNFTQEEWNSLRSKFLILENLRRGQHNKYTPKAFTEKGLYMLATILKSPRATQTTIAIVETFTKIREFARTISQLPDSQEESEQKALMQKSGEMLADIIDDNILEISGDETTIELNLAILKVKHTTKREKRAQ